MPDSIVSYLTQRHPILGKNHVLVCPHCMESEFLFNELGEPNAFCGLCGQVLSWKEENNVPES